MIILRLDQQFHIKILKIRGLKIFFKNYRWGPNSGNNVCFFAIEIKIKNLVFRIARIIKKYSHVEFIVDALMKKIP